MTSQKLNTISERTETSYGEPIGEWASGYILSYNLTGSPFYQSRCIKWRQIYGILCDKKVSQKLKGKFYRTAVRLAMLYGVECWPIKIDIFNN